MPLPGADLSVSRRSLLGLAAAAYVPFAPPVAFRLGIVKHVGADPMADIGAVGNLGITTCMPNVSVVTREAALALKQALDRCGIEATALVTLGPGVKVWDFLQGPSTIGLVPRATRRERIDHFKRASDFAKIAGIPAVQTHCGFIPENPADPLYEETVAALREVAQHCRANGQTFLCETGQETPVTLLRAITDAGGDNLHVGLDTANLVLYGKANPLDALEVIGTRVRSVMAKDGNYPTDPRKLGREVPIGEGKVDFVRILPRLAELGYRGAITIEREIRGPQQIADLLKARKYLEAIVNTMPRKS
ncbi:MAG: sugar phosphate isomerase/epimerase [Acidobacteria bacterium]|nr:sugar phosphate isomerase/epimerase [Acidobacteriota bacterium]